MASPDTLTAAESADAPNGIPLVGVTRDTVTAVVLCGGRGERLATPHKPLKPFLGAPLLQRVLTPLQPQVAAIQLSVHDQAPAYAGFGWPLLTDIESEQALGPISGIAAALVQAQSPWILMVPGDAPLIPTDLVDRLGAAAMSTPGRAAYVVEPSGPQPLVCLLAQTLAPSLLAFIAAGERSPLQWLRQLPAATVAYDDHPHWAWSLNTPEEWAAAESAAQA